MRRLLSSLAIAFLLPTLALAEIAPREGWVVIPTAKTYETLLDDAQAAVKAEKMGVVFNVGPTEVAKSRGVEIPGNRVLGVFNNVIAVRTLALSEAAMIEAPIRLYITEQPDGTATLSYKTPSHVFAPYVAEAGPELAEIAKELDATFERIAARAVE